MPIVKSEINTCFILITQLDLYPIVLSKKTLKDSIYSQYHFCLTRVYKVTPCYPLYLLEIKKYKYSFTLRYLLLSQVFYSSHSLITNKGRYLKDYKDSTLERYKL